MQLSQAQTQTFTGWQKSSFTKQSTCVQVATLSSGEIAFSNSNHPGVALIYTCEEVDAFLKGVKNNEFDHFVAHLATA